jgi:hypothetical protein
MEHKMSLLHIELSAVIDASPAEVYAVLSDYRNSHPGILPKKYFSKLVVERGGRGEGTLIEVHMHVGGTKRVFHQIVSEPEPGRVLVETDLDAGVTTTFTVDRQDQDSQSRVTITIEGCISPGLQGFMEKFFQPSMIQSLYQEELELLANYVSHGL